MATHETPSGTPSGTGTARVKRGMAEMLKGGVIMDVVTPEQAKIAEDAGAVAVMALERVPADIRAEGGVARMSDPDMIDGIIDAVSIPVMAKARIGHFVEAQVLQSLGVDYVDESEVLTPADEAHHIDKWAFTVPFVCGATNLGEALRRIAEGAAMIRSKGEAGTGNVVEATRHMRSIRAEIRRLATPGRDRAVRRGQGAAGAVRAGGRGRRAPGKLPVVLFTAGGIATPADAAMMMQLGAEGVFVGSGIFKSGDPAERAGRDRQGHHLPRRPRRDRQGLARARRGDGRHQRRRRSRAERAVRRPRLVSPQRARHRRPRAAGRRPRARRRAADAGAARAVAGAPAERARRPSTASSCPAASRPRSSKLAARVRAARAAAQRRRAAGMPVYGSCAGMILLADRIAGRPPPDQETIGGLDVTVRRNAFGRQVDSFEADLDVDGLDGGPVHAVFIRAPWVEKVGARRRGARPGRRRSGRR